MAMFFIDFENVHSPGLDGIEKLGSNDKVYIFYTTKAPTLTFQAHQNIMKSAADIKYTEVGAGGKNALDFQLSSFLGRCTALYSNEYFFIISNDTGYDFVKSFWLSRKEFAGSKLYRMTNIQKAIGKISHANEASSEEKVTVTHEEKIPDLISEISAEEIIAAEPILSDKADIAQNDEDAVALFNVTKEITPEELNAVDELLSLDDNIPLDIVQFKKEKFMPTQKNEKDTAETAPPKTTDESEENVSFGILKNFSVLINESYPDDDIKKRAYDIFKKSNGKQDFYRMLIKSFGMEEGVKIYKLIRPEFQNIRNML